MEAFWERGFEATSLQDLTERTGVQKASLYGTFGDKRSFFLQSLRRYQDEGAAKLAEHLAQAGPVREVIRSLMLVPLNCQGKGCFCVNTQVELASHDPEIAQTLHDHFTRTTDTIGVALQRGVDSGEFRPELDVCATAEHVLTLLYGLYVVSKGRTDNRSIAMMASVFVDSL